MPGIFYGKEKQPLNGDDLVTTVNMPVDETVAENAANLEPQSVIGELEIKTAAEILQKYRAGKANLESRVVEDEEWWKLRHWEVIRPKKEEGDFTPEPSSAWLFNAIINKHADAMDNYPVPAVLPRERSDEKSADRLTEILPVVMEYNNFEKTYSENWWEKLKHGTAAYMVLWNPQKENGLGDVDIKAIDMLSVFWEPGIMDIQKSANLFVVDLVDETVLNEMYPAMKGKFSTDTGISTSQYKYDDTVDTSDKCLVVDWYYKVQTPDGRTLLHYCKFSGSAVLYASENDPTKRDRGYYDHGRYPVVFDVMFPEKGTPAGFGYVAICKDPQMYIDKLSGNILQTSMMGTKKRFFVSSSTAIKEDELMDWNKQVVHVEGELSDARIQEIRVEPLAPIYQNVLQMKIEELKETAANRDVTNGGTTSGVSAAAAIAALQEAGNKVSRDMIASSYRAYTEIVDLTIELIRQFYDFARSFRITGQQIGDYEFVEMSNLLLKPQKTGTNVEGETLYRLPIFDLKVKAQKRNPFSRMEENERAKELYSMGFFDPSRAQEALNALEMMDFEGIEQVKERIAEGATLMNIIQQQGQQIAQMQMMLGMAPQMQSSPSPATAKEPPKGDSLAGEVMKAQTPMTSYGERLAKRAGADMNVPGKMAEVTK
jgi:hypothetical protein